MLYYFTSVLNNSNMSLDDMTAKWEKLSEKQKKKYTEQQVKQMKDFTDKYEAFVLVSY